MKSLYLIRHGKSNWNDISLSDIDRPLKKRGQKNSLETAVLMKSKKMKPDLILSSPATRTFETAKIILEELDIPLKKLKVLDRLYLPDFPVLFKTVLFLDKKLDKVAVVGHEPSLSVCVNRFVQNPLEKLVTASLTTLDFDVKDWRDINPKRLKSAYHYNRHDYNGSRLS